MEVAHSLIRNQQSCVDSLARFFLAGDKKIINLLKPTSESDAEPLAEPVDVIVDTIIGYLEKSTGYMRTVGNEVFGLLSGVVKESTIDLILAVRSNCHYLEGA
jgi:DNA polymerase phi